MNKTLLAIISTERDNALVLRHWAHFKMTGCDILGAGEESGSCVWPEKVVRLDTGVMGTRMTPAGSSIFGLCQQELDIIKFFLKTDYHSLMVVEADNLFCRKPPEHPGDGIYLSPWIPNYTQPGIFKTPVYFSTPRWMDQRAAKQVYAHGQQMLNHGDCEHWISDRFPARICHAGKIPIMNLPAWSPFPFVWDAADYNRSWIRDARAAIKLGAICLHSVKKEWQLEAVKDLIKL